jgi:hypothetical protein
MNRLLFTYLIVLIVCLFIGLFNIKILSKNSLIIFAYIFMNSIVELFGTYYLYFSKTKIVNALLFDLQSIGEILLLSFYFKQIIENKIVKNILPFLTFSIVFVFLLKAFNSQNQNIANYNYYIISIFLFILLSIIYLKEQLKKENDLFDNTNFWFVTGILFFNSCFFFLSGLINKIKSENLELAKSLFQINYILNIIFCVLITYGFICQARLAKRS